MPYLLEEEIKRYYKNNNLCFSGALYFFAKEMVKYLNSKIDQDEQNENDIAVINKCIALNNKVIAFIKEKDYVFDINTFINNEVIPDGVESNTIDFGYIRNIYSKQYQMSCNLIFDILNINLFDNFFYENTAYLSRELHEKIGDDEYANFEELPFEIIQNFLSIFIDKIEFDASEYINSNYILALNLLNKLSGNSGSKQDIREFSNLVTEFDELLEIKTEDEDLVNFLYNYILILQMFIIYKGILINIYLSSFVNIFIVENIEKIIGALDIFENINILYEDYNLEDEWFDLYLSSEQIGNTLKKDFIYYLLYLKEDKTASYFIFDNIVGSEFLFLLLRQLRDMFSYYSYFINIKNFLYSANFSNILSMSYIFYQLDINKILKKSNNIKAFKNQFLPEKINSINKIFDSDIINPISVGFNIVLDRTAQNLLFYRNINIDVIHALWELSEDIYAYFEPDFIEFFRKLQNSSSEDLDSDFMNYLYKFVLRIVNYIIKTKVNNSVALVNLLDMSNYKLFLDRFYIFSSSTNITMLSEVSSYAPTDLKFNDQGELKFCISNILYNLLAFNFYYSENIIEYEDMDVG